MVAVVVAEAAGLQAGAVVAEAAGLQAAAAVVVEAIPAGDN